MDTDQQSLSDTDADMSGIKTIEAVISGRVQKVGFRACVRRIAQSLAICGEVMNMEDGRVMIRATAESIVLEKFLSSLYSCNRAYIREIQVNNCELTEFSNFSIVRGTFQ